MKNRLKAALPVLAAVALLATLVVQPATAGSPPNRLDPPGGGPVGLLTDACESILGPFKDVADFFDLDVCPSAGGRVVPHPHIWNVFAADNWDSQHPSALSTAAINDLTRGIVDTTPGNNYLGALGQYGVSQARFDGSSQNSGCSGAPSGTTNFVSILLWVTCEVQTGALTGIPYPDNDTLYVIYLPASVDVDNGPFGGTCNGFTAYHFWSMALTVDFHFPSFDDPIPSFDPHFQSYPFAVVPLKCAMGEAGSRGSGALHPEWVSEMASHEIVEAVTDPIVPDGWIDRSTFDFGDKAFHDGEAADICEAGKAVPSKPRRLDNGILVAPYWSNQDNACMPRVQTLSLSTSGLPDSGTATVTSRAIYGDTSGHAQALPHAFCTDGSIPPFNADCIAENAHVSWSFPSPVAGSPGVQYVTTNTGGSAVMDRDVNSNATYTKQYRLTTQTSPAGVAPPTLTPSQWVNADSTIGITTDEYVPSGVDRYKFSSWSWTGGSSNDRSTSIHMDGPKTATASYLLQHQITFAQTGIPGGVPWNVTVGGTDHAGPYSEWFNANTWVDFGFQDTVSGLTPGTRYKLVSVSEGSPLSVTSTRTITATYKTQYLLKVNTSGLPSPNLTTITNGSTPLGTANDSVPLQAWVDSGATLNLAGDADVNGANGIQYFAQTFAPAPPPTMTGPFETTLTYKTIAQLIQEALAGGGIVGPNGPGVANALTLQFAAVQADMGAKRYAAALGDLGAFVDLVTAQCCVPTTGMSITTPTATTLRLDAMLVYHTALCLAGSTLKPKQLADDYAYYQRLVTSLGGNVLPPCS
jgi:hypothetical protein